MDDSVRYKMIKFAEFSSPRSERIASIRVTEKSNRSFFYITYHYGDFRYVWGRPHIYWSNGNTSIERVLCGLEQRFRRGSSISIFFNLGFFIRLDDYSSGEARGIRIEQEYGYDTSIAKAQYRLNSLIGELNFFRKNRGTKDSINWANKNIKNFGEWSEENLFKLYEFSQNVSNFSFRRIFNIEKIFIENKINRQNYCSNVTSERFFGSDPYNLCMVPQIKMRESTLILQARTVNIMR